MRTTLLILATVLFLGAIVTGCGRKGPLEAPPDDDRDTEQNATR